MEIALFYASITVLVICMIFIIDVNKKNIVLKNENESLRRIVIENKNNINNIKVDVAYLQKQLIAILEMISKPETRPAE